MNISIIQPHNLKAKGLRLRPGSVRASDQSLLIDLGSAKLLLNRASAVELTSQLLDQLADKPRRDNAGQLSCPALLF